jgi:hypothetical protein
MVRLFERGNILGVMILSLERLRSKGKTMETKDGRNVGVGKQRQKKTQQTPLDTLPSYVSTV